MRKRLKLAATSPLWLCVWFIQAAFCAQAPAAPIVGHSIADAILSRDASRLYIVSPLTHSILILDTQTDRLTDAIALDQANPPGYWPLRLALSPDGSRLYSANWASQSVSVIDTATNRVTGSVQLQGYAQDVAVTADGRFLCVEFHSDRIVVVDTSSLNVARTIKLDPSDATYSIAAAPGSTDVCIASQLAHADPATNSRVYCVNPATGNIVDRIDLGRQVTYQGRLAFTPDGSRILLPCGYAGSSLLSNPDRGVNKVYVIGRSERRVLQEVSVVGGPSVIRVTQDGTTALIIAMGQVYVLDIPNLTIRGKLDWTDMAAQHHSSVDIRDVAVGPGGKIYVPGGDVDGIFIGSLATLRVTDFLPTRTPVLFPTEALLSPDGKTLYVCAYLANGTPKGSLFVVDLASGKVKAETTPTYFPTSPKRGPRTGRIYVVSAGTLLALSPETGRIERTMQIRTDQGYYDVAISPDERRAYLTSWNNPYLAVVDLDSGTFLEQIDVGWQPQMVTMTKDGGTIVVSRQDNAQDHGGLVFVDAATLQVTTRIDPPLGVGAVGRLDLLVVSPDQQTLYWETHADYIHVIDLASRKLVKTIDFRRVGFPYPDTGLHPSDMVFSPDGKTAYVTAGDSHWVAVIDTQRNEVTDYFYSVGIDPAGIAISPAGDRLYVICQEEVVVLDIRTKQRIAAIPLTFGQQLSTKGIVNAASFAGSRISPGEIIALLGAGVGPANLATPTPVDERFPTSLAGLTVTIDGLAAPILYSRSDQADVVVPFGVRVPSNVPVEVYYGGIWTSVVVPTVRQDPGVFTLDGSGRGQAAALNQNGATNGPGSPAAPGEVVVLYATGLGAIRPAAADGQIATDPLPAPVNRTSVQIGGQPAEILYAGAAAGTILGIFQISVRVPAGIAAGEVAVAVQSAGSTSQAGVTINVRTQ